MKKENIPHAIAEGQVRIGTLVLACATLEDGTAIITQESLIRFLEWLESGEIGELKKEDFVELGKFVHGGHIPNDTKISHLN